MNILQRKWSFQIFNAQLRKVHAKVLLVICVTARRKNGPKWKTNLVLFRTAFRYVAKIYD